MNRDFPFKKIENLTNALDMIGDIAAIISLDHKVIFENSICQKIHGKNLGMYCYSAFTKNETVCEGCPSQGVFRDGVARKAELISYDAHDEEMFVEIIASPIKNEEGEIVASVEIVRNLTERKRNEIEKERLIAELQSALLEIKTLRGILPICSFCKKIRDDKGYWNQIESYFKQHSEIEFSHGFCPKCAQEHYPEFTKRYPNQGMVRTC